MKKLLIFCLLLLNSSPIFARDVPSELMNSALYDPSLNEDFLLKSKQPLGRPGLRVKYYDEIHGLLAGFQAPGGKRILFRAQHHKNGALIAAAFHFDETTQSVKPLMAPSIVDSSKTGRFAVRMLLGGVDVQQLLQHRVSARADSPSPQRQQLQQMMKDKTGRAFSDGVMALYVLLEPYDTSGLLAMLKMPFGAMRMSAEMATSQYHGFEHAEQLVGRSKANALRHACLKKQCQISNRQFMLHDSGLFDMLSNQGDGGAITEQFSQSCSKAMLPQDVATFEADGWQNDPECHGCCGPKCWGCLGFSTPECEGHDHCVRAEGHLACAFSSPISGGNSLAEAIVSVVAYLGEIIARAFGFVTGGCDSYVICDPWDQWDKFFWSIP